MRKNTKHERVEDHKLCDVLDGAAQAFFLEQAGSPRRKTKRRNTKRETSKRDETRADETRDKTGGFSNSLNVVGWSPNARISETGSTNVRVPWNANLALLYAFKTRSIYRNNSKCVPYRMT